MGLWHVHRFGAEDATTRLRAGIRALNERNGVPNTETNGYHETITVAYVRLIDQFLASAGPDRSLESHLSDLLGSPLADRAFLFRFWSRDLLMSPAARATWTPPDLRALTWPSANE